MAVGVAAIIVGSFAFAQEPLKFGATVGSDASVFSELAEPRTIGLQPPKLDGRTFILFDGKTWTGWKTREGAASAWEVQSDGSVLIKGGDAISEREFGDFQLHVEFFCPKADGKTGQARSNSGVYIHGRYEIQVLDSHGDEPALNGCGALYSIAPPLVNASREGGQWQSYDIVFRAPRMDEAGKVTEQPRITVLHNGVVIHNNLIIPKPTGGSLGTEMVSKGPIMLQDHGDPVRYRNIWIREL